MFTLAATKQFICLVGEKRALCNDIENARGNCHSTCERRKQYVCEALPCFVVAAGTLLGEGFAAAKLFCVHVVQMM